MNVPQQHIFQSRPSAADSGSALKIALILGLMILLCLASVRQASASGTGRLGFLARMFDFAGQLLTSGASAESDLGGPSEQRYPEQPAEQSANEGAPAAASETVRVESAGQMEAGEPAEVPREPAYMPFMSFENFTDDQQ